LKSYDRSFVINKKKIHYWLGNGAEPTKAVHKILERFGMLPVMPPPHGSKYTYEKPQRTYNQHEMEKFTKMRNINKDTDLKQRIELELERMESLDTFEGQIHPLDEIDKVATSDIDSDEGDIFKRNIKFQELKRRFETHRQYSLDVMKGNDYRFNIYLRKMQKLSKSKLGGLDMDGYKDYLNNLLEFKKIKSDLVEKVDKGLKDELKIDYTGQEDNFFSPPTGRAMKSFYDVDKINSIQDKVTQMNEIRKMVIDILKDEIETKNRFLNLNDDHPNNTYMMHKDEDGYAERFTLEHEFLDKQTRANQPTNKDLDHDKLKFSATYINKSHINPEEFDEDIKDELQDEIDFHEDFDDFLKGYDTADEEVCLTYTEYLHKNPHLFRKIRFLQRENKIMNMDDLPELQKLQQLKKNIVRYLFLTVYSLRN
jgi:hypothetical protein